MDRRVVVTGVGAVSPLAHNASETYDALLAGKSGIERIPEWDEHNYAEQELPVNIGARIKNFVGADWITPSKNTKRMGDFIQYAMAATKQAWQQAGLPERLDDDEGDRAGCILGVGLGGMETLINAWETLRTRGPRRVSAFTIPALVANDAPGYVSIEYNLRNANWAPASACSSGAHGIGEAFMYIKHGRADLMVAGGTEAVLHPMAVAGFAAMHALCATGSDHPQEASRPFDKNRDGFVMGEGAGILILEEYEKAKARGANILAEVIGYGATSDAHHITAPPEMGEGAQRAMKMALEGAKKNPEDVGYINAHGTSTPLNDKFETQAIKAVFGDHAKSDLLVSSTKSMTGHLLGAAGGLEAVISVKALEQGILPPTMNLNEKDPDCDLDYIANKAREKSVDAVMSNSFGFGGTNAVLLFGRA